MSTRPYDALVIGGGPAGSVAAIVMARAGLRVAVLEKARHPRFHIGESMLPRCMDLIRRLGLERELAAIGPQAKFGAEFGVGDDFNTLRFGFDDGLIPGSATFNVERAGFDRMLLESARSAGAEVFESLAVRQIGRLEEGRVELTAGEGRLFAGRTLLDCSGQATVVGRRLGTRRAHDDPRLRNAAYFEHFDGVERASGEASGDPTILMCREGWFWLIGLGPTRTSVGFVCPPDLARSVGVAPAQMLRWAIGRCPVARRRMRDAVGPADNRTAADFSYTCRPFAGPGYMLVGDAACFLDPIFSTGVALAMVGAEQAGLRSIELLQGRVTPAKARRDYHRFVEDGTGVFRGLIRDFYTPGFRDLFMSGSGPFRVHRAVVSALAGEVFPRPAWALRWRLWFFKACARVQRWIALVPRRSSFSLLSPGAELHESASMAEPAPRSESEFAPAGSR